MLVLIGKFENLALKILQKYIKKNKQNKKTAHEKNKTKQKAKKIKQKKAKGKTVRE